MVGKEFEETVATKAIPEPLPDDEDSAMTSPPNATGAPPVPSAPRAQGEPSLP
jgi:hypothetical protein